jgi:hypothetical protein
MQQRSGVREGSVSACVEQLEVGTGLECKLFAEKETRMQVRVTARFEGKTLIILITFQTHERVHSHTYIIVFF